MMQINGTSFINGTDSWDNSAKYTEKAAQKPNTLSDIHTMALDDRKYVADITSSNKDEQADKIKDSDREKSNDKMDELNIDNTMLSFSRHKETGEIMVKIIDKDTGEVVREIPPERLLDSIAQICKNSGFGVDKKV